MPDDYMNYTPMRDFGGLSAKTIFEIPENKMVSQMSGVNTIEDVVGGDDIFSGKVYKWKNGPLLGERSKVAKMCKRNNNYFIVFENGEFVPVNQISTMLEEVFDDNFNLDIKPNVYNKNIVYNDEITYTENSIRENNVSGTKQKNNNKGFDPVIELLNKKRKTPATINVNLDVNLVPKELYLMLIDNYDDAEEKIIDYIFNDDGIESIKNSVKMCIRNIYGLSNKPILALNENND